MSPGGWDGSQGPRGWVFRVMLATLVLLTATAVASPAPSRADTRYPVLLVHGGLGSPSNFPLMAARLVVDGYRPYTVNLDLLGNKSSPAVVRAGATHEHCPPGAPGHAIRRSCGLTIITMLLDAGADADLSLPWDHWGRQDGRGNQSQPAMH
jgi:hypothetical protein